MRKIAALRCFTFCELKGRRAGRIYGIRMPRKLLGMAAKILLKPRQYV